MCASPRYVTIPPPPPPQPIQPIQIKSVQSYVGKSMVRYHPPPPPTHPTHPTYPNQIGMVVCMQVQGMLSSPPHPPHPPIQPVFGGCMQVQGMLPPPTPPHPPTHPTHPSNLYWEDVCKSKVCYHPPPPHPPTHPTQRGASERKTEAQVIHARRKWERGTSEKKCEEQVRVLPILMCDPSMCIWGIGPIWGGTRFKSIHYRFLFFKNLGRIQNTEKMVTKQFLRGGKACFQFVLL